MALITPEELIVLLDLPADTQPTDRAQLVCTLVIQAVNRAAHATLSEPFADGIKGIALTAAARLWDNPVAWRSSSIGSTSTTYAGDVASILTRAEKDDVAEAVGLGGPQGSFPEPDWHWTATTSVLKD